MSLITLAAFRAQFNIDAAIVDEMLDPAINSASVVVSAYVGAAAYADAGSETPTDPIRSAMLQAGEFRAAMYYLILADGTSIRPGGLVKTELDAFGSGSGTVLNNYLNPGELLQLREQYAEEALSFLAPYWNVDGGVNVFDKGGITVGQILPADLEPDPYLFRS